MVETDLSLMLKYIIRIAVYVTALTDMTMEF